MRGRAAGRPSVRTTGKGGTDGAVEATYQPDQRGEALRQQADGAADHDDGGQTEPDQELRQGRPETLEPDRRPSG